MAIPLIGAAAMAAGRAVAKKLATRAVAGITGAGAKQVNPVYKMTGAEIKKFNKFVTSTNAATKKQIDAGLKKLK